MRTFCAPGVFALGLLLLLPGCAEPVREDRTIGFSKDGGEVSFQHGDEGVYVAKAAGGGATRIYEPEKSVIATSRPLASPVDKRLLFATAEHRDRHVPPGGLMQEVPPEGRIAWKTPILMSVWIRDAGEPPTLVGEPKEAAPPAVRKLFEAPSTHVGYVSAGLGVRWHPNGTRVLFIAALNENTEQHSVFEYDLQTGNRQRVFPHAGDAVVCDWTPAGGHLVCVVGTTRNPEDKVWKPGPNDGVWIGTPGDDAAWWRVPGSAQLPRGELPSLLESLRASRPAWTREDSRFAFVARSSNNADADHRLISVDFATRTATTLVETDGPISDLQWSPDASRLCFVEGPADMARLWIVEDGVPIEPLVGQTVRKFAGFDASGERLAVVAPEPLDVPADGRWWALLLLPDPTARDLVLVADSHGSRPPQEVFSGMRVTFPQWSPTEPRLSLWLTFQPRCRSLINLMFRLGLGRGDPAATLDMESGAVSWMTVSPQEELQVGHYHLLKRNYAEAWTWYEKARKTLPRPTRPKDWAEFAQRISTPDNSRVFEALCLQKLDRPREAAAAFQEFADNFYPAPNPQDPNDIDQLLRGFGDDAVLLKELLRDLFVAEVFLSVDAAEDGIAHFQADPGQSEAARTSRAILLSQLLLIARKHDAYVKHCTDVLGPLSLRIYEKSPPRDDNQTNIAQALCLACLAPLFHRDFVKDLSADTAAAAETAFTDLHARHPQGLPGLAADVALRALALKRGDKAAAKAAEERIRANPDAKELGDGKSIDETVDKVFREIHQLPNLWNPVPRR